MRLAAAILLVLVASVAPATAQTGLTNADVNLYIEAPRHALEPGASATELQGFVEVRGMTQGLARQEVILELVEAPSWAQVRFVPERIVLEQQPGAPVQRGVFTVLVRVGEDAPAYQAAPIEVMARTVPSLTQAEARSQFMVPVQAAYAPAILVPRPVIDARLDPQGYAEVSVGAANVGNGHARVRLELVEAPPGVEVGLGAPMTLVPGSEGRLQLRIDAPDELRAGTIRLLVAHAYALDSKLEGEPVEVIVNLAGDGGPSSEGELGVQTGGAAREEGGGGGIWPAAGTLAGATLAYALARRWRARSKGPTRNA